MDSIIDTEVLTAEKGMPKPNFDLLIEILSVKKLYEKPGMEDFMVGMAADTHWLSNGQKDAMYDAMLSSYSEYDREEFCWVICDFVARQFSFDRALAFFEVAIRSATESGRRGIYLGLNIIARSVKEESGKMRRITLLLK
jgi:hypothetical protein